MRMLKSAFAALPLALVCVSTGCPEESATDDGSSSASKGPASSSSAGGGAATGAGGMGGAGGMDPDPEALCAELGLPIEPFSDGPYGPHRGDLADDFSVTLVDGSIWSLSEQWSGCETYVFSTDRMPVSDEDATSVWENDLDELIEASPRNVHYFFFSRATSDAVAAESTTAMQARIDALLPTLPAADAAHWRRHLHVIADRAPNIEGWLGDVLTGHGRIGMGIDRGQRVRGAGYLADVDRYDSSLANWPWENNLKYHAHEPLYFNAQHDRLAHLSQPGSTIVTLFDGEVLQEFAETTVTLPSAAEMAGFDTFEVEVVSQCPNPEEVEIGNCGAWDYLANLYVKDAMGNDVELARFITSYHRETHWVVDVTPMMALLLDGGMRTFKWSFAPSWNVQPTATQLRLHFSNRGRGVKPRAATFLFAGGLFNDQYNATRVPVDVPISAAATKVELWALTTGHGAETGQCAEFCNHQHEFTVDGEVHLQEFPDAGSNDLCIPAIEHGMVPNQAGTWWFGRGGWCPGQQVEPFVVDVTSEVTPGGTASVSYRGLYNDGEPPANAGDVLLSSYLVVYE